MRFTCVKCNTRYRINPQHLKGGTSVRIRCRNCGAVLRVRAPGAPAAKPSAADDDTNLTTDPASITATQPTSPPEQMGSNLPETDWHRVHNGHSDGPHSLESMVGFAQEGSLLKTTLIWEPSWAEWKPAGHVALFSNAIDEGLQAALAESPTRSTETPAADAVEDEAVEEEAVEEEAVEEEAGEGEAGEEEAGEEEAVEEEAEEEEAEEEEAVEEEAVEEETVEEEAVEEEAVEEEAVEEEAVEEEAVEEEAGEEEAVEEEVVEEEAVEEEAVEEEAVKEEATEEESSAGGPDLDVLDGGRDDEDEEDDDGEGQEYDSFEQAFFADEVAAEHQTLSQAEIDSLEEVARTLEKEDKDRRSQEKSDAKGISLKGVKYDKSELSVSGPAPSARESRMLRKQFGVMKEMDKEVGRRKLYFIAGAVVIGVVGTLFVIDVIKPTDKNHQERRSASAYNTANQKTLDVVVTTPDISESPDIQTPLISANTPKKTTGRRSNRRHKTGPIELAGEPIIAQPKKTKLEKEIAKRDKIQGLSAKEYERLLADPEAKRGERRIKLQGTDNLGVKERPITPTEFQERLNVWRKSIWSCTSNEQMTVTITVNISGGVEQATVKVPVPDPAGAACVRNILLRKRFHLLPTRQTISARITRPL